MTEHIARITERQLRQVRSKDDMVSLNLAHWNDVSELFRPEKGQSFISRLALEAIADGSPRALEAEPLWTRVVGALSEARIAEIYGEEVAHTIIYTKVPDAGEINTYGASKCARIDLVVKRSITGNQLYISLPDEPPSSSPCCSTPDVPSDREALAEARRAVSETLNRSRSIPQPV